MEKTFQINVRHGWMSSTMSTLQVLTFMMFSVSATKLQAHRLSKCTLHTNTIINQLDLNLKTIWLLVSILHSWPDINNKMQMEIWKWPHHVFMPNQSKNTSEMLPSELNLISQLMLQNGTTAMEPLTILQELMLHLISIRNSRVNIRSLSTLEILMVLSQHTELNNGWKKSDGKLRMNGDHSS